MNQEIQFLINTLQGPLLLDELQEYQLLPHEHVFSNKGWKYKGEESLQINMQNLDQIRKEPFTSLENLSLIDIHEMLHELRQIQTPTIILECTSQQNGRDLDKLKQISSQLPMIVFLVGYSISNSARLSTDSNLYSRENIQKNIEFELQLGTNGVKPAFFGEIILSDYYLNSQVIIDHFYVMFQLSHNLNIPILINLNYQIDELLQLRSLYARLMPIHSNALLIIINYPIIIETFSTKVWQPETKELDIITRVGNLQEMLLFARQSNVHLVFDICNFSHPDVLINIVDQLELNGIKTITISSGVEYKTNLTKYGGRGYMCAIEQWRKPTLGLNNSQRLLQLFSWAKKQIVIEQINTWKCDQCLEEIPESKEKFKKFDKEFCSIVCLRKGIQKR